VTIQAPPAAIFPMISQISQWEKWSAWSAEKYPDMKRAYEGPDHGPGATMCWTSQNNGSGKLIVVREEPGKAIWYELYFQDTKTPTLGTVEMEPTADGTKVIWHDHGDVGWMIPARYMIPRIEKMVSDDFQSGLTKLKTLVEKTFTAPPDPAPH
jgi:uncharacterized protein YndB with AHSA1/START domain